RVFFLFSSRRRHTRFSRDWSSDVCSSDLKKTATKRARKSAVKKSTAKSSANSAATTSLRDEVVAYRRERILQAACDAFFEHGYRSEERRVGEECRARWGAER